MNDIVPHVPVGKLYYRVMRPDVSNSGAQSYSNVRVLVGVSQRYSMGSEVEVQAQTDLGTAYWYALRMNAWIDFKYYDPSEDPAMLAGKLRRRLIDVKNEAHAPRCELRILAATLKKMKAVQAVYDDRTSRVTPIDKVLPENVHAWRDDWETMEQSCCTLSATAKDEVEARALMILQAKAGDAGDAEYLTKWLAAGQPVKRITSMRLPPSLLTLESLFKGGIDSSVLNGEAA